MHDGKDFGPGLVMCSVIEHLPTEVLDSNFCTEKKEKDTVLLFPDVTPGLGTRAGMVNIGKNICTGKNILQRQSPIENCASSLGLKSFRVGTRLLNCSVIICF